MRGAHGRSRDILALGVVLSGILLATAPRALALNPALDISQYAHTSWKTREGFTKGSINTIAQTPDGYLWIGTDAGLSRFDGVRNVPWPPAGQDLPSNGIRKLLGARDGTLWIGTIKGLARLKDGKLTQVPELTGHGITTLLEDREGTVWVGTFGLPPGMLCAIQSGTARCYGQDGRLGNIVLSLYESKGDLWVGAQNGLWRWKPDPPQHYPMPIRFPEISDLLEGDHGALWLAMRDGLFQFADGKAAMYQVPAAGELAPRRLLRDREGGLWIGTSHQGLLHVHQGRTDVFSSADGLTGDSVFALLEDREGNVWAATNNGLDRFREIAVPTLSSAQGLSRATVVSVVAAKDGSVWLGTFGGLNHWKNGQIAIYRNNSTPFVPSVRSSAAREIYDSGLPDNNLESIFEDDRGRIWVSTTLAVGYFEDGRFVSVGSRPAGIVNAIVEDTRGNVWIANQDLGLFRVSGGRVVEQIPWEKLRAKGFASVVLPDPVQGGLWLGFVRGGVAHWKDGAVRTSYDAADGLGKGRVNGLQLDGDGTLWATTEGGLSRLKNGRWATLTSRNGLPCDAVHWALHDDAQSSWLYMDCGLVRIARPELDAWSADPNRTIQTALFDNHDGVSIRSYAGGYTPHAAKSRDGKLWFTSSEGVSVVDPRHLPFNKLPPPVHVEQIIADGKSYSTNAQQRLPPLIRNMSIEYTALSFAAPEKVKFRYKLEGHDSAWQDAGTRRQAFYNDLPPRDYRFRVIACNNSGVWNEAGASFDFSIDPAYYQTTWFRLACVTAFLALLGALYHLRLRQVARQFNMRLEERVGERTRIARDLHDTLLQSFQGVLLKFHALKYQLQDRPETQSALEAVVEQARQAIAEGRDTVQGLRSSGLVTSDFAGAIGTLGEDLAAAQADQASPEFHVHVEGASRDLAPLVWDDLHRIAGEALRNAFRHAHAKRIEVEIRYDRRQFRLRVRDDGKGIAPKVLAEGRRDGHFGLAGMQERAKLVGGKLAIWSDLNSGSELELTIPAAVAYAKLPSAQRWRFLGKRTG